MASVMFSADLEEGNIFASLGLAKQLRDAGIQVFYVGIADAAPLIEREGFRFLPVLQGFYPSGSKYSTGSSMETGIARDAVCGLALDSEGPFTAEMQRLRPDVLVVQPYLALESLLMHLRFGVAVVHLRTGHKVEPRLATLSNSCQETIRQSSYGDQLRIFLGQHGLDSEAFDTLAARIAAFPEVVTLPPGYECDEEQTLEGCFYIGSSVDATRDEELFPLDLVPEGRDLILCSMGSQSHRESEKAEAIFHAVLEVASNSPGWFFVLSVGKAADINRFQTVPNAVVCNWIPQLTLLTRARAMIMHGGLGTARECISSGVPMLAYPLMRDQFVSAASIERHGLGIRGDETVLSATKLREQLQELLSDGRYRARVQQMRDEFDSYDEQHLGLKLIEKVISSLEPYSRYKPSMVPNR